MRKIIIFFCCCAFFACKQDTGTSSELTDINIRLAKDPVQVNPAYCSIRERSHELQRGLFSALIPSDLLHAGRKLELKKGTLLAHILKLKLKLEFIHTSLARNKTSSCKLP